MLQVLCVPFIATNDRVGNFADHTEKWTGDLDGSMASPWIDLALAMVSQLVSQSVRQAGRQAGRHILVCKLVSQLHGQSH